MTFTDIIILGTIQSLNSYTSTFPIQLYGCWNNPALLFVHLSSILYTRVLHFCELVVACFVDCKQGGKLDADTVIIQITNVDHT